MSQKNTPAAIKSSIMIRRASWRRLKAAKLMLKRHKRNFSENHLLECLLRAYLVAWRGKPESSKQARRYNIDGQQYIRRSIYLPQEIYRMAWHRGSHSGESVSRMIDFAIRHYLPAILARHLAVSPKTYFENRNSEYWRRRWYLRKNSRPACFLNYEDSGDSPAEGFQKWTQNLVIRRDNIPEIPPWDLRSCYAYLYHSELAIYAPPRQA